MKSLVLTLVGFVLGSLVVIYQPHGLRETKSELAATNVELVNVTGELVQYVVLNYQRLYEAGQGCYGFGNLGDDLLPALAKLAGVGANTELIEALKYVNEYFALCPPDAETASAVTRILVH